MADFTVKDKFDKSKRYTEVQFGANAPLLEIELNELQKIQNEARAELLRSQVYSGVLDYSNEIVVLGAEAIDSKIAVRAPGAPATHNVVWLGRANANVYGYRFELLDPNSVRGDKANHIPFTAPPTSGTRTDLTFVEAWFEQIDATEDANIVDSRVGAETSRRTKLNWAIRTVSGASEVAGTTNQKGGTYTYSKDANDIGLYRAGDGSSTAQTNLGTVDGYVYAIPLFAVDRRNNAGYGVNNGNGARDYYISDSIATGDILVGNSKQVIVTKAFYDNMVVNDVIAHQGTSLTHRFQVISKDGTDTNGNYLVTIKNVGTETITAVGNDTWGLVADRPDGLYSNIIDKRDIIDQRHYVPLQKVDYSKLLNENFDKYLRGELNRQRQQKTYHGVKKTPVDSNHVFYASLDGTTTAETGSITNSISATEFEPAVTGAGARLTDTTNNRSLEFSLPALTAFTHEAWFKTEDLYSMGSNTRVIMEIANSDRSAYIGIGKASTAYPGIFHLYHGAGGVSVTVEKPSTEYTHVRMASDGTTTRWYFNGVEIKSYATSNLGSMVTGKIGLGVGGWTYIGNVSDIAFSTVDRGNTFATLPTDFIEGRANVSSAYTGQRKILSEAQRSHLQKGFAKLGNSGSSRGISVSLQQSATAWTAGDKIKVTGVAGEVITGVLDTDTAKSLVVKDAVSTDTKVFLDSVAGIADADTVKFYNRVTGQLSGELTVATSGVNTTEVSVTFTAGIGIDLQKDQWYLVETTASTSSPVVRYKDGSIYTQAGTWTGLGTNVAEFTIGTLGTGLNVEDLEVTYSITMPSGQGATSEVYDTVLAGEAQGKKLVKGSVAVLDDYKGKVAGSVSANPNIGKGDGAYGLQTPSGAGWTEHAQAGYDNIMGLDGTLISLSTSTYDSTNAVGEQAQHLFSIDLVRLIEDKYGVIPSLDKVQWLRDNVKWITTSWWGYGSSPSGNKATTYAYRDAYGSNTADYVQGANDGTGASHTSGSVARIGRAFDIQSSTYTGVINDNGTVNLLAFAEQTDGTTASTIRSDYMSIEVELTTEAGFDLLVPENPRRDDGVAGVLQVNPRTKEVRTYFDADEDYKIVTYGDYTEVADRVSTAEEFTIVAEGNGFFITDLSSAVGDKQGIHQYINPAYRVLNDRVDMYGQFGFGGVPFAEDSKNANIGLKAQSRSQGDGFAGRITRQYGLTVLKKPMVGVARYLVVHNGELKIFMYSLYTSNGDLNVWGGWSDIRTALIPIAGRPLVKEQEGIERASISSNAWRTHTGEVIGYLDGEGNVIATYQ